MRNICGITLVSLLAIATLNVQADDCQPGVNCKPPNCRCWNDPAAPGRLTSGDLPQIVVIWFNYAINSGNVQMYENLLSGIKNPNGCPARASFYVTEEYTDFDLVAQLQKAGYELGANTITSTVPSGSCAWNGNYSEVVGQLVKAGIPADQVSGASGPEVFFGGNDHLSGMVDNNLVYDTTCGTVSFDSKGNYLWPYTYDFITNTPQCSYGIPITKTFPGVWQFLLPALEYGGRKCATPSSCIEYIKSAQDAHDIFYNAFEGHLNQVTRPPFIMSIDPLWLTDVNRAQGTQQFLQLLDLIPDVWIVTTQQALAWIKDPVSADAATGFKPWSC